MQDRSPVRAWGMPGAQRTRSRACRVESTRVSHHGCTGEPGIPARDGVNVLLRALPGDRALLSPSSSAVSCAKLDASVEASGPHDFTVRENAVRLSALPRPSHPCPTFVTTAKRPSFGQERRDYDSDLGQRQNEIFFRAHLDR